MEGFRAGFANFFQVSRRGNCGSAAEEYRLHRKVSLPASKKLLNEDFFGKYFRCLPTIAVPTDGLVQILAPNGFGVCNIRNTLNLQQSTIPCQRLTQNKRRMVEIPHVVQRIDVKIFHSSVNPLF